MVIIARIAVISAVLQQVIMNNSQFFNLYSKIMAWCHDRFNSGNPLEKLVSKMIAFDLLIASKTLQLIKRVEFPKRSLGRELLGLSMAV